MRPLLKPALRRVWRDDFTLQIGLDPGRCVVLTGLSGPARQFVESLDGTGDLQGVLRRAGARGLPEVEAAHLLGLLTDVLQDAAATAKPLAALSPPDRDRLAPDLAALSLVAPEPDGGIAALARRRAAAVLILGAGRIGATVGTLLAAAATGTVVFEDDAPVTAADLGPAGLGADALGRPREKAAADALRAAFPDVRTRLDVDRPPDVAVVASCGPEVLEVADRLTHRGVPHVFAEVRETTGIVGPLVMPGVSSCRRCVEMTRSERDPAWPRIVAQIAIGRSAPDACDITLATLVAAQVAGQVLALLDGGHVTPPAPRGRRAARGPEHYEPAPTLPTRSAPALPSAVDGVLESSLASGVSRRRSFAPHPMCGCRWSCAPQGRRATGASERAPAAEVTMRA